MAIDITEIRNLSSGAVRAAAKTAPTNSTSAYTGNNFGDILTGAIDNLNTTNAYLSDYEDEEIKWSLGESENTHDLAISMWKASTALQYTVAVRDKLLSAYKEIMQMQI